MNKIVAFIDFTEGCKIALKQSAIIAKATGAELCVAYIMAETGDITKMEYEIEQFTNTVSGMPEFKAVVGTGDLLEVSSHLMRKLSPDLVVVGTHGIKGIKQHLFGAHILKLVQSIPFPCLVVQENTVPSEHGWKYLMLPVSAHPGYRTQMEQSAKAAKIFHSQIIQYEIDKTPDMDEIQLENTRNARDYFNQENIPYTYVMEDATVMSVGNSRQQLKYASENHIGVISSLSEIAPADISFGKADLETLLTNEFGIPILCCNE
ncbi:MAG: universal stress protein [Bacteroidetes bacterium]|nr:universal stress protein [Bacteroidota bacterium]